MRSGPSRRFADGREDIRRLVLLVEDRSPHTNQPCRLPLRLPKLPLGTPMRPVTPPACRRVLTQRLPIVGRSPPPRKPSTPPISSVLDRAETLSALLIRLPSLRIGPKPSPLSGLPHSEDADRAETRPVARPEPWRPTEPKLRRCRKPKLPCRKPKLPADVAQTEICSTCRRGATSSTGRAPESAATVPRRNRRSVEMGRFRPDPGAGPVRFPDPFLPRSAPPWVEPSRNDKLRPRTAVRQTRSVF